MAKAKEDVPDLDQATIETLKGLVAELWNEITKFQEYLDTSFSWSGLSTNAETIYQLSGAIRDKMPEPAKRAPVKQLCQHAYFVNRYASEKNRSTIESNFTSLKIDLRNVEEEILRLEKALAGDISRIEGNLDFVKDSVTRSYIEESCKCLRVGAFRASVVMAGCALESMVRVIYQQTNGTDSSRLPFSRVIQVLEEDRQLQPDESAIVNICRSFRNLTSHPSGFQSTKDEASSLLSLAVEQLKKR